MSTTTKMIEEKKSFWDTIKDTADSAMEYTKETAEFAWDIAKENPVSTVILMGGGFALANKAWFPAAVLTVLGTAGVTLNQFMKEIHKDNTKTAFWMTWRAMDDNQRAAFVRQAKPELTDEEVIAVIKRFNMECGV